jgi:hypothetical protein
MKRSTKTLLVVGGALGLLAVGGVAYAAYYKKPQPSVPAGQLKAGSTTPVTSFTPGVKYTFIALVPTGVSDNVALEAALKAAGWQNPSVVYFMGTGTLPSGFEGNANSYAATGTWGGAANAPVPAGVIAAATP